MAGGSVDAAQTRGGGLAVCPGGGGCIRLMAAVRVGCPSGWRVFGFVCSGGRLRPPSFGWEGGHVRPSNGRRVGVSFGSEAGSVADSWRLRLVGCAGTAGAGESEGRVQVQSPGASLSTASRGAGAASSSRSDGTSSAQPGRRHQRGLLARQQVRVMPWGGLAMWLGGSAAPLGWTLIGRSIDRTQAPEARLEATGVCGSRQRVRRLGGIRPSLVPADGDCRPKRRALLPARCSTGLGASIPIRPADFQVASGGIRQRGGSAVADPLLWGGHWQQGERWGEAGQLCPLGWRLHGFVLRDGGRAGWSLWQGGWGVGRIHVVGGGAGARDSLGTEGLDSVLRAGQRRVCPLGRRLGRTRRLCWEGAYPVVAMGRCRGQHPGRGQTACGSQQPGRRRQRGFRAAASWGFDLRPRLHNR